MKRAALIIGLSDVWFVAARDAGLSHDEYSFTASNWTGTKEQVETLKGTVEAAPNSSSRTAALKRVKEALVHASLDD